MVVELGEDSVPLQLVVSSSDLDGVLRGDAHFDPFTVKAVASDRTALETWTVNSKS